MVNAARWLVSVLSVVGAGCETVVPQPRVDSLPPPVKHAYHAGIYYSAEFKAARYFRWTERDAFEGVPRKGRNIEIGAASVRMLDQIFSRSFAKTSVMTTLSAEEARQKRVDLILVPSIESFQFENKLVGMSYRLTFWGKEGQPGPAAVLPGGWNGRDVHEVMEGAALRIVRYFNIEGDLIFRMATASGARTLTPPAQIQIAAAFQGLQHAQETRLLPISLRVNSEDNRNFYVRPSDMRLALHTGDVLEPLSVWEVASVMERTRSTMRALDNTHFDWLGLVPLPGFGSGTFVPDRARLVELQAARPGFDAERRQISRQLENRSFASSGIVLSRNSKEGFLFFRLPVKASFEKAVLSGWVIEMGSVASAAFEVAVNKESVSRPSTD